MHTAADFGRHRLPQFSGRLGVEPTPNHEFHAVALRHSIDEDFHNWGDFALRSRSISPADRWTSLQDQIYFRTLFR